MEPVTGSALRRSSRLMVDGSRPSLRAIARTDEPRRCRSAMWTRSSSDKNLAEAGGGGEVMGR
jgi:hypothetical protein